MPFNKLQLAGETAFKSPPFHLTQQNLRAKNISALTPHADFEPTPSEKYVGWTNQRIEAAKPSSQ
jgi:hypothetical protein